MRAVVCLVVGWVLYLLYASSTEHEVYKLKDKAFHGPSVGSIQQVELNTQPEDFGICGPSRLAILLTRDASAWLAVAHGLKTIGVPFCVTREYRKALRAKLVFVYPELSGALQSTEELRALAAYARGEGSLIASHATGGGLNELFGFSEAMAWRHSSLTFDTSHALASEFVDAKEKSIPIGNASNPASLVGTYHYLNPRNTPLAVYEDGTAAVTHRKLDSGTSIYAFGFDLGNLLRKGYDNREEGVARSYVNGFEPALDVLLRLVRNIYREAVPSAVTLGTVPEGKTLSVLLTYDVDFTKSMVNARQYAALGRTQGVPSTFFIQTKYVKDWNDDVFFNEKGVEQLRALRAFGVDIGSHSVSHSQSMAKFQLGDGKERYPTYRPFVKSADQTENGSLMGELRVSKYLLDTAVPGLSVRSFRPGHLKNPYTMPQALVSAGYANSSSVTANNSMTHLPFQLTLNRQSKQALPVFEFPVTVEDEELPRLGERVDAAVALANKIRAYGGLCVVLIHPNLLSHKYEFQKEFVERVRPGSWFGSLTEFGDWWARRNEVQVDVVVGEIIRLTVPRAIEGLTLKLPQGFELSSIPQGLTAAQQEGAAVIVSLPQGVFELQMRRAD